MNFDFLKDNQDFKKLYHFCSEAEMFVVSQPDISAVSSRKALESVVKSFYKIKYGAYPENSTLFSLLEDGCFSSYLDDSLLSAVHLVRQIGNNAAHGEEISKYQSLKALEALYYSVCEILKLVGVITSYQSFNVNLCQPSENKNIDSVGDIDKTSPDEDNSADLSKYKKNIDNSTKLHASIDFSEEETRKIYIDSALKEAGWEVWTHKNAIKPGKACIEIELLGMQNKSEVGYADYVLYDDNGVPLAVIEAKRASKDEIVGSQQAKLYADLLEKKYHIRPVIYYTNGYKIMMVDGCGYPTRKVYGYYTKQELHSLIIRRGLHTISDCRVDQTISDRPFIQNAVTNVTEAFNKKQRKALLVMATGTGKTRCAISVVDVLQRNGWAKRILFLADRTALVTQAKRAFEKFLPHSSRCVLSEEDEENRDYNATIVFSTYNTMSNILDKGDRKMGVGHFDLIIIDECHRSIYNKYKSIFDYFDSLLLGLTATPREQVDESTYELFNLPKGEPTFFYDLETAVSAGYLVPYLSLEKTTKLLKNGLNYDDLNDEEKEKYEDVIGDPESTDAPKKIDGKEFYERIINSDTIDAMLQTVMNEGLRVKNGEELGKTIIFAVNHTHAQKIVERFNILYPEKGDGYCKLIDNYVNYSQTLIDDFSIKDKEPVIAVSVAMLDTGVDVPEVLNLVFFKRIYSKIKFWQMIGRGTRVCKGLDVMSPSKDFFLTHSDNEKFVSNYCDKQGFYIFDFCGNFDFFRMNPDGKEPSNALNLSQRIFNIKVDLIYFLQASERQCNPMHKAYYDKTKAKLISIIGKLNTNLINVRNKLKYVDKYKMEEAWQYLSVLDVKEIKSQITPLIDPNGDEESSKLFDLWLFNIELAQIEGDKDYSKAVQRVTTICSALLEKLSIPQVKQKQGALEEACTNEFWSSIEVDKLEKLREDVRDLIKFLERDMRSMIETNFSDYVIDKGLGSSPKMEFKNYKERVIDYLSENVDLPVIEKIQNLEQLDKQDINDLQEILWKKLGTKEEFDSISNGKTVGVFVRKIVGLSSEKVNEILNEYLQEYNFNSQQEEFLNEIVTFVKENGDILPEDLNESDPFKNIEYTDIFDGETGPLYQFIEMIHNSVTIPAGA